MPGWLCGLPPPPPPVGVAQQAAVGYLLYYNPDTGGRYYCSASVVGQYNVLVTSAGCMRSPSTGTWYASLQRNDPAWWN